MHDASVPARRPRRPATLAVLGLCAALLFAGFIALGTWQVQRRAWKHALIERVEQRVHAPAAALPLPAEWPHVSTASHEYLRVHAEGTWLHDRETLVQASTKLGPGFWVLTPLRLPDGHLLLVNRGFVPPEQRAPGSRLGSQASGPVRVEGLLRISEPSRGFPRRNDPAAGRWYSRDVAAIAAARGLTGAAPFFVDATATPDVGNDTWPRPGLTIVDFPDHHLVYALTWYALAAMTAAAAYHLARDERRLRG